jgi:hypothetical protein
MSTKRKKIVPFSERHRLDEHKIGYLKAIMRGRDESAMAGLRQSPEERKARIEAHKNGYKAPFMAALEQAQEKRWGRK